MYFFNFPARNDLPNYSMTISLAGVIYTIAMRYNTRMDRWIMDVMDSSGNPLIMGLPVLIQANLTAQYVVTGLPDGTFFASDDANSNLADATQPTRYSFGLDHTLWFGDPTVASPTT